MSCPNPTAAYHDDKQNNLIKGISPNASSTPDKIYDQDAIVIDTTYTNISMWLVKLF